MNEGYVQYQTPTTEEQRIAFHRKYSGNIENATTAVMAFVTRTLKTTAPTMSTFEHRTARKAEFLGFVDSQLIDGTYAFEQVEIEDPNGLTDDDGNPMMLLSTVVDRDDDTGQPIIAKPPPYAEIGILVTQFDITSTEYDPKSQEQFIARQDALLAAQTAKADRDKEIQTREMVEQRGLREKAEAEAEANVVMARAVIEAEQRVAVAEQAALEAEEQARMRVLVAEQARQEQETILQTREIEAQQLVAVAQGQADAAVLEAQAISVLAEAEEERIQRAGAMTEMAERSLEIMKERDIGVAAELAQIATPAIWFGNGGEGEQGGNGINDQLLSMTLMRFAGVMPADFNPMEIPAAYAPPNNN